MNARDIVMQILTNKGANTYCRNRQLAIVLAFAFAGPASLLPVGPAQAGWRDDMGVFRIGIVARTGSGAIIEGAEPIQKAFSDVLGMPVGIYVARDYGDLIDAQASGRVDYAIHTATSYATLSIQCGCVTPVVSPVSSDGSRGIRSVLISRKGGPVNADDIPNYKIAFGPPDSVSGAMLPVAELRPNRQPLTGAEAYLVTLDNNGDAIPKLASGEVDAIFGHAGAGGDQDDVTSDTLAQAVAAGVPEPKILWSSEPLHNGPHAVKKSLPSEAREMLVAFMTDLKDDNERVYDYLERRFGGGFAPATEADYRSAIQMVRAIGGLTAAN